MPAAAIAANVADLKTVAGFSFIKGIRLSLEQSEAP